MVLLVLALQLLKNSFVSLDAMPENSTTKKNSSANFRISYMLLLENLAIFRREHIKFRPWPKIFYTF